MKDDYIGKHVKEILAEAEDGLELLQLNMEAAEFGHMSARIDEKLQFLCVKKGSILCQVNQEQVWVFAGEGIFINMNQAYRMLKCNGENCEFFMVSIAQQYLQNGFIKSSVTDYISSVAECPDHPYKKLEKGSDPALLEALFRAESTAQKKEMCWEIQIKSELYLAWTYLYRGFADRMISEKSAAHKETEKLKRMLIYLHDHYRDKITLAEMSKDCGVSGGEFCRFFKRKMEQTPFEYLQAYRIERSLPELLEKADSITEVALRHGFNGSSYYAETFKKEMGCAPGDFRKWFLSETKMPCPLKKKNEVQDAAKAQKTIGQREALPTHLL